jgi:hypothetical protein
MKKKGILLAAVILFTAVGFAQAQEGQLSGTIDATYVSRYLWRGFDKYARDHSAFQPSIDLDLWQTGFGLNVWWSMANGGGSHVNNEEIQFTAYYGNSLLPDEQIQTDYRIGWMYYAYPDMPVHHPTAPGADAQEVFAGFSWPKVCPFGIVPSYTYIYMWQAEGGESGFRKAEGGLHVFGIGYDLTVPGLLPETPEQILNLSAHTIYNDSTGGDNVDHDWSHMVYGISTSFDLGNNLALTPGFYVQQSWEDTVNTSDEYWVSLGLSYSF